MCYLQKATASMSGVSRLDVVIHNMPEMKRLIENITSGYTHVTVILCALLTNLFDVNV